MGDDPNAVKRMQEVSEKQSKMNSDDWIEEAKNKPKTFPLREVSLALIDKIDQLEEDVRYQKFLTNSE